MSKSDTQIKAVRNHLAPLVRLRKGVIGLALMCLAFYLLFGPQFEGDSPWLTALVLIVAFLAFGFGWTGTSHGVMGWSRHIDFDFEKNEVRQTSASILGRSKPFVVPFTKIADLVVRAGPLKGEGGLTTEAAIELQDQTGRVIINAGMFDSVSEAEALRQRLLDARAMAEQQEASEAR